MASINTFLCDARREVIFLRELAAAAADGALRLPPEMEQAAAVALLDELAAERARLIERMARPVGAARSAAGLKANEAAVVEDMGS